MGLSSAIYGKGLLPLCGCRAVRNNAASRGSWYHRRALTKAAHLQEAVALLVRYLHTDELPVGFVLNPDIAVRAGGGGAAGALPVHGRAAG